MAERLRRWTANPLYYVRVSSNLTSDVLKIFFGEKGKERKRKGGKEKGKGKERKKKEKKGKENNAGVGRNPRKVQPLFRFYLVAVVFSVLRNFL